MISISGLFFVSSFAGAGNGKYVHAWIYRNVIDHNIIVFSEAREYGNSFISDFSFHEEEHCYLKAAGKPNIIILMVESLSSYQSDYFSGIKNWTPNLDLIASRNSSYKNFYANGFTTEDGEVSLLTGLLPIYRPSSYSDAGGVAFNGFFGLKNSLPNILKKQGYRKMKKRNGKYKLSEKDEKEIEHF